MSTVDDLFNRIFLAAPQPVKVRVASRKDYESLRTALVKKNAQLNALAGEESLCSSYEEASNIAEFWRGERRRKQRTTFEILE